jgi:hypothetical protein
VITAGRVVIPRRVDAAGRAPSPRNAPVVGRARARIEGVTASGAERDQKESGYYFRPSHRCQEVPQEGPTFLETRRASRNSWDTHHLTILQAPACNRCRSCVACEPSIGCERLVFAQIVLPRRLLAVVAEKEEDGAQIGVLLRHDLREKRGHGVDLHAFPFEPAQTLGHRA